MGYETELLIGKSSSFTSDETAKGDLILEDGEAYKPYLKDSKGEFIKTGRKETWFEIMATVDLCKCGSDSSINKIDYINNDDSHHWFWYHGSEQKTEDCYGAKLKPVPIADVINALRADSKSSEYRRFKWALALLESMKGDSEGITVLLYGH